MTSSQIEAPYRILVAIGNDNKSDPAVAEAIALTHGHARVELHAVNVVDVEMHVPSSFGIADLDQRLALAPNILEERLARVASTTDYRGRVFGHFRVGPAAPAILQTAIDIEADVIVVGTRHRSGLERLVLGSVAEHVMREAHCPVMVVTTKNYEGTERTRRPDPPCAACLKARQESASKVYWCERHARPHMATQVFEPTERMISGQPTGVRIV